jgi:hypothetical protein
VCHPVACLLTPRLTKCFIVLEIKNDLIRLFADLVEMNKTAYFTEHLHFGAIGRHCGGDRFFSPAQYAKEIGLSVLVEQVRPLTCNFLF